MSISTAQIYDIISLALILVVMFRFVHQGFVAGVISLVGNLVSLVGAAACSRKAAPLLFEKFFASGFEERIGEMIGQEGFDLQQLVRQYVGFLPDSLVQEVLDSVNGTLTPATADLARRVVTEVIEPLFTPVIAVVIFFILYALCRMVLSMVASLLTVLNKIPLAGSLNQGLGALLGLAAGLLDVYLLFCILWGVMVVTSNGLPFLNESVLRESLAYSLFQPLNPFL